MMNFPGIAKLLNIKIPRLRVEAPTSVLIRPAARLHCTFIYVDMDISKMFHDFSGGRDRHPTNIHKFHHLPIESQTHTKLLL